MDTSTQTDIVYCCHMHEDLPNIPEKRSAATSTCIENDDDDEIASRKRKDEILKDDKKLYLMFERIKDDEEDQGSSYLYRNSGERCTYYYKTEDRESKSDLSSLNDNHMSPMVLSTSSIDVSIVWLLKF